MWLMKISSNLLNSRNLIKISRNFPKTDLNMSTKPVEKEVPVKRVAKEPPPQLKRDKNQVLRKKNTSYIPGTVSLQVLGTGANGAPTGVYMFTDQSRYLFNCGEGTQRLAHEHKTKLSRLEQIFVTRNEWHMVGGFPGLALTVQDTGVREISVLGPPFLDNILLSMKRFVVLKTLKVNTIDCTEEQDFEDNVMSVKCLPIYSSESKSQSVIAYICNLKPRPGALNLEKCVEQGVPPGPLLGKLKNGFDVTLDNGKVVKSKDVSEPSEKPLSIVFLDIPNEDYLPSLENQVEALNIYSKNDNREIALVIHFSPLKILENNCYRTVVEKLSNTAHNIYLNSSNTNFSGYIAAHRIQYQLNQLNSRVFPLLAESITTKHQGNGLTTRLKRTKLDDQNEVEEKKNEDLKILDVINSMTSYHLRPRKCLDHSTAAKLDPEEYIKETRQLENFPALLKDLKESYPQIDCSSRISHYPRIIFLGTGSCIPNKTRNVSSILLQTTEDSFILMDCGEGTLGQIIRFFGKAKAEQVIKNLHLIYVSHLHADHHIGLIGLLNERRRLVPSEKLLVLAPIQIESWLNFYDSHIEPINESFVLIGNNTMLTEPLNLKEDYPEMNISHVSTCLVRHCAHSYGVSVTLNDQHEGKPIKITYSGDTMPCPDLVELGMDSTILIHESTMEDDLIDEAEFKLHSTISQAIKQGNDMQAKHIILTHFSQRYAKLPRMHTTNDSISDEKSLENVAIAFDNMQVTLADLPHFHHMYPALKALFAEHAEEMEQKALKRELKLERKRKLLVSE